MKKSINYQSNSQMSRKLAPSSFRKMKQSDSRINTYKTPSGNQIKLIKEEAKEESVETVYQYVKPDDQLVLTPAELEEEHARILSAANKLVPQNLIRYSFKERKFKPIPNPDQTFIHLEIYGNLILKNTEEARAYEKQQKIIEAKRNTFFTDDFLDEYTDASGQKCLRIVKNKFNSIDRAMQTINSSTKETYMQTEPPEKINYSDFVNQYVLHQAYTEDHENQLKAKEKKANRIYQDKELTVQMARRKRAPQPPPHLEKKINDAARMLSSARLIERMLSQNLYQDIIYDFKYFDDEADAYKKEGSLLPLWRFPNTFVKKMAITSVAWNPIHPDLFAVASGSWEFFAREKGHIVLFSLKNPSYCEHMMETECGCMTVDFHPEKAYLLAAGFSDGSVSVYDLRYRHKPNDCNYLLKQENALDKHGDPVWQVKWQKDDLDGNYNFCSISSDGRVKNWTVRRLAIFASNVAYLSTDTEISSKENVFGSGTCFDFNKKQAETYLIGTEEGHIYELSLIYHNKILKEIKNGHSMPIYNIKWNYYLNTVFITCSSDWTVKIWDHDYRDPVFTFDLNELVADVAWSPYCSTVFAAITINGYIYVYDLSVDTYEPLCVQNVFNSHKRKRKLTRLAFNPTYPVILVTDNRGAVYSFKISPNLRSDGSMGEKKVQILKKIPYEMSRLKKIIAQEVNFEAKIATEEADS